MSQYEYWIIKVFQYSFSTLILGLQLMINFVFHQSKLCLNLQSQFWVHFFCWNIESILIFFQGIISKLELQVWWQAALQLTTRHHFVLGLPGYLTGYFSQHKSQPEPGIPDVRPTPIVENQTEKTPAAVVPDAEVELDWKDIIQLLKQKLTSQAFDKTLRYILQFHSWSKS